MNREKGKNRPEDKHLGEVFQSESNNRNESGDKKRGIHSRLRWIWVIVAAVLVMTTSAWSQSDRGTLTGVVTDSTGAVLAGAALQATNLADGQNYAGSTTPAGLYSIASLPAGVYELKVDSPGFKTYIQRGITISVAQVTSLDVRLEVGQASETVSVTSDAALLNTENAEVDETVPRERLNDLPINFAGNSAIRDPLAFAKLAPGSYVSGQTGIRINGLPTTSFKILVEGQDTTNANLNDREDENHPSVEMMQEFTLQSSNFSPEFGAVTGGLFNFTARSGTNQFHGSAYEYLENEDFNAGQPFTTAPGGGLIRPKNRQNDYGFTIGGPFRIPKLYDGRNRTFFFFNWEQYRQINDLVATQTVPTTAERTGDFSGILTGVQLGTDVLGRPIMQNAIYDPATARTVTVGGNQYVVTDPFAGNMIPPGRINGGVGAKVTALIPSPSNGQLINNYAPLFVYPAIQTIPAVKVDQTITNKWKASMYWSLYQRTTISSADGVPLPLSNRRDQPVYSDTYRGNTDYTLTPNLLFHFGLGYIRDNNIDSTPLAEANYNASTELGFGPALATGMPALSGMANSTFGGIVNSFDGNTYGITQRMWYETDKATGIASATWIKGNHSFKGGAEFKDDMYVVHGSPYVAGAYAFNTAETSLPYLNTSTVTNSSTGKSGTIGFAYASFLLGQVDSGTIGNEVINQFHRPTWALYVQDTWRVNRRLTVDYGLRWDFTETHSEHRHLMSGFSPTVANENANGLLGAMEYDGFGSGRCNCNFLEHYPYAIGPRLGVAYRLTDKIVARGGAGISYGQPFAFDYAGTNYSVVGMGYNVLNFSAPAFGTANTTLSSGFNYTLAQVNNATLDPGIQCCTAINNSPSPRFDPHGDRPPRVVDLMFSMQDQITPSLAVEAAYVGNRAIWLISGDQGNLGLVQLNALSAQRIAAAGLNVTNATDYATLNSTFASGVPQAHGFSVPYASFPTGKTLAQALRPYPQYGNIYTEYSPTGSSWYDSLQVKATKRLSYGLDLIEAFTWSKSEVDGFDTERGRGAAINDALNRASNKVISAESQPLVSATGFTYQIPTLFKNNLVARTVVGGWTVGGLFSFASGLPISIPNSNNNLSQVLFRGTYQNRVPGQPLFLKSPNSHSFKPSDQILNPAAWTDAALGTFGTTKIYQGDYRWQRKPDEEMNLAKSFPMPFRKSEGSSIQIRGEFFNVFNHLYYPAPNASNPSQAPTSSNGGFGQINVGSVSGYRTGQIVARFQF